MCNVHGVTHFCRRVDACTLVHSWCCPNLICPINDVSFCSYQNVEGSYECSYSIFYQLDLSYWPTSPEVKPGMCNRKYSATELTNHSWCSVRNADAWSVLQGSEWCSKKKAVSTKDSPVPYQCPKSFKCVFIISWKWADNMTILMKPLSEITTVAVETNLYFKDRYYGSHFVCDITSLLYLVTMAEMSFKENLLRYSLQKNNPDYDPRHIISSSNLSSHAFAHFEKRK